MGLVRDVTAGVAAGMLFYVIPVVIQATGYALVCFVGYKIVKTIMNKNQNKHQGETHE